MISMSDVWDRTAGFLAENRGVWGIAAGTILVPLAVQTSLQPLAATGGAMAVGVQVLALLLAIVMLLGQLAIIALALDPAIGQGGALRRAGQRLLPVLGVSLLLLAGLLLLLTPVPIALAAGGYDFTAAMKGSNPDVAPGAAAFIGVYIVVLAFVLLALCARLVLVHPVLVAERRFVSAVGRSLQLTRGLTLKIIGVLVLYLIVVLVPYLAVKFAFGTLFAIALGGDDPVTVATVLTAVVSSAALAVTTTIAAVFVALLYRAVAAVATPIVIAA